MAFDPLARPPLGLDFGISHLPGVSTPPYILDEFGNPRPQSPIQGGQPLPQPIAPQPNAQTLPQQIGQPPTATPLGQNVAPPVQPPARPNVQTTPGQVISPTSQVPSVEQTGYPPPGQPVTPNVTQQSQQPFIPRVNDVAPPFNMAQYGGDLGFDPAVQRLKAALELMPPMETQAGDAMWEMLQQMPQRPKRGLGRRILAGTAGAFLGPAMSEGIMYGGYNSAMNDWKQRFDPLKQLATDERAGNQNQRMLNQAVISGALRDMDIRGDYLLGQGKLELSAQDQAFRQQLEIWDRENPKLQLQIDQNGDVYGIGPGGTVKPLGIKALSPTMKLMIDQQNRIALARIRADEAIRVAQARPGTLTPFVVSNPKGETYGYSLNNKTGAMELLTIDGQPVTNIAKPGTYKGTGQPNNIDFLRGMAGESLRLIDDIIDEKGNLTPEAVIAVGLSGTLDPRNWVPGQPGFTAQQTINTIKSQQVLTLIQEMKKASETGATGFGALNLRELGVLENAATLLAHTNDEKIFAREMKKIQERLKLIMVDPIVDPNTVGQQGGKPSTIGPVAGGTASREAMENQPVMLRTLKNDKTGETRQQESRDGGKTWTWK